MVSLSPLIRLDSKETFCVLKVVPTDLVVVRYQDLISKTNFQFNAIYNQIIACGGLHNFLNFQGSIVLSLIMKDRLIANSKPSQYARAINTLVPDFYTTVDGETYEGEFEKSEKELERIGRENKELISLIDGIRPIGLVKGYSEEQVIDQVNFLKSNGIKKFIFHLSDFFRTKNPDMVLKSRKLSRTIYKKTGNLTLYGFGYPKRIHQFAFADRLITQSHFVSALNGWRYSGNKLIKYKGGYNEKIISANYMQLYNYVNNSNLQKKIMETA